jgi:hypothetical protein
MSLKKALLAMTLAGLWALGCHGGSPTSSSGFQLVINVFMANSALTPTIFEAQLLVDGATAVDASGPTPSARVNLSTSGTAGSGSHTMQALIVSQTSTPNSYTVSTPSIQVFDASGNLIKTIQLPTQTAVLATGATINYSFSL